jgi:PAP2 superfamily
MTTLDVVAAAGTPVSRRSARPWWVRGLYELGLLAGLYAVYMLGRAAIGVEVGAAHTRGQQIMSLESALHVDVERPFNKVVSALPAVGLIFAYLYATLHYVVTPVVLGWTALRHRSGYATARNGLLLATGLGLVMYWLLPTAPPRLLDIGLVDTMARFSDFGWWGDAASAPRGMESLSNQYAAMPSLHVGWAVWVALCLSRHARTPFVRRAAWAYPALMTAVVIGTANHYLLDVLAGALCALVGSWVAGLLPQHRRTRRLELLRSTDEHARSSAPPEHRGDRRRLTALDPDGAGHLRPRAVGVARCDHNTAGAGSRRHAGSGAWSGACRRADARASRPRRRGPGVVVGPTTMS